MNPERYAQLGEEFFEKIVDKIMGWAERLPEILLGLVIIFIAFWIASKIRQNKRIFDRFSQSELLTDLLSQTASVAIKIAGLVAALELMGAGALIGAILGTAGVVGLGVSFAFKDIVENYIAGVILSAKQPFLKGHHLVVGGHEGIVQRMTTRMTMLKSLDGNNISIPNATIFKSNIINYSRNPERRFSFTLGINPNANPDLARALGVRAMKQIPAVLDKPMPFALIDSIGDSSIVLSYYGWMDQSAYDFGQVRSSAIFKVKDAIEDAGIEIPDPSYIVNLRSIGDLSVALANDKPIKSEAGRQESENKSTISYADKKEIIAEEIGDASKNKESDVVESQLRQENFDIGKRTVVNLE